MSDLMTRKVIDNRMLRVNAGSQLQTDLGSALSQIMAQDLLGGVAVNRANITMAGAGAFSQEQRIRFQEEEAARQREIADLTGALQSQMQNQTQLPQQELDAISARLRSITTERDVSRNRDLQESLDAGRLIPPEDLNAQYSDIGLEFDRATTPQEAETIASLKRAELIRNAIINRSPQGIIAGMAKFGAGLLNMATDPLELATMFIPIVGQAGRLAAVARFGRIGGRAVVGATEGLVGSALTEPFYYALSRQQQLDYTMSDALMNIGLGAIIGGGIGGAIGVVGKVRGTPDRLAPNNGKVDLAPEARVRPTNPDANGLLRLRPDMQVNVRERAQVAIRQFVNDQPVDVQPVINQIEVPQSGGAIKYSEWNLGNVAIDADGNNLKLNYVVRDVPSSAKASGVPSDSPAVFLTTSKLTTTDLSVSGKKAAARVIDVEASLKNPVEVSSGDRPPSEFWAGNEKKLTDESAAKKSDGIIIRSNDGEAMVIVYNPDNVRIVNDIPTPKARADAAATLAKSAQDTVPLEYKDASRAVDDVVRVETATETRLNEDIADLDYLVKQVGLANQKTPKLSMKGPRRPQTLSEFVRSLGGINDNDPIFRGELKHIGINPSIKNNGLSNVKSKLNLDDIADAAQQDGFLLTRDTNDLISALRDETNGDFTFSRDDAAAAGDWQDFQDSKASVGEFIDKQLDARDAIANLTDGQRAAIDESLADIAKAEHYAEIAKVSAACLGRT